MQTQFTGALYFTHVESPTFVFYSRGHSIECEHPTQGNVFLESHDVRFESDDMRFLPDPPC